MMIEKCVQHTSKGNLLLLKDLGHKEQYLQIKYMTSVSKNVYIDKLADIVNKYKNKTQLE